MKQPSSIIEAEQEFKQLIPELCAAFYRAKREGVFIPELIEMIKLIIEGVNESIANRDKKAEETETLVWREGRQKRKKNKAPTYTGDIIITESKLSKKKQGKNGGRKATIMFRLTNNGRKIFEANGWKYMGISEITKNQNKIWIAGYEEKGNGYRNKVQWPTPYVAFVPFTMYEKELELYEQNYISHPRDGELKEFTMKYDEDRKAYYIENKQNQ